VTLAELLVSASITTTVVGVVLAAVMPVQRSFGAQQEGADLQQRVRVAIANLSDSVRSAGLVVPYRIGQRGDGAANGVFYRAGTIGVLSGQANAYARGLAAPFPSQSYFLADGDGDGLQIMRYDGLDTTTPVVDNVVGLAFDYFGDAEPPQVLPPDEEVPQSVPVTYGPSPPALDTDDPGDSWPAGENCIIGVAGGQHVPRLDVLAGAGVVPLPPEVLTDGPWCPDAAHPFRVDADLLRVRLVRIIVRVQATTTFRERTRLLARPGDAGSGGRLLPEEEIRIDIAPRNLIHTTVQRVARESAKGPNR
jgi:type II secretory pathway pseudopilin PulG